LISIDNVPDDNYLESDSFIAYMLIGFIGLECPCL
jgi:hypothetical protein